MYKNNVYRRIWVTDSITFKNQSLYYTFQQYNPFIFIFIRVPSISNKSQSFQLILYRVNLQMSFHLEFSLLFLLIIISALLEYKVRVHRVNAGAIKTLSERRKDKK